MNTKELSQAEMAALSPKEYRSMVRQGEWPVDVRPQYCCEGYSQHALVVLPQDWAHDFFIFCNRNPRPCYICEVTEPGSPHPKMLAPEADLRTDLSKYRVYEYGEVIDEPTDIKKYWRDDLVAFLLPCSYGFEGVLRGYNIKFRYMGSYVTNLPCVPAGPFRNEHMIVTCRLFKTSRDAVRAIQVTSRLLVSHGAPIHIGDPALIGIKDICHSDRSSPSVPQPPPEPGEVALFWACAMTPENAVKAAKPPLAIMHYGGRVFVSDRLTEEFAYGEEVAAELGE